MGGAAPVAVVIPAYRSAGTLGECLESVLGQSLPPAEIVVVDDGSPDDIAGVVAPFRDRVRCIRQENRGPGAARNRGVEETAAPLLAFLDADDVWLPRRLERTWAALEEQPAADLVFADAWDWDGEVRSGSRFEANPPPAGAIGVEALVRANFIPILTVLMRREAFLRAGGFDPDRSFLAVEDYDLWLRVLLTGEAFCLREKVALYRRAPGSLGSSANILAGLRRVHEKLLAHPRCPAGLGRAVRRREGLAAREHAWELLEKGAWREARVPLRAALGAAPFSPALWKLLVRWLLRR